MSIRQKFRKLLWLLMGNCNVYFCLKPKSRQNPIEKLRTATDHYFLYNQAAVIRIPVKMLVFFCWPLIAVRLAIRHYLLLGTVVKLEYGIGTFQQFTHLLSLAWFEFIHPRYYYQYRLFDKTRMQKRSAYLFHRRNQSLFMALNGFASGELINNKEKFAEFCLKNDLPTPKPLALVGNGNMAIKVAAELWQKKDIVIKPVNGHMGRDIQFGYAEGNRNYRYRGKILTVKELLQQIAAEAELEDFLVQERLYNHPELCPLSNEYLASVRIVTFLGQDHAPAFLAAYIGLPYDAITVSNEGRGFPLDLATGKILACPLHPIMPDYKRELIEASQLAVGNTLPYWQQAKELVCKAHRLMPDYFSLGWDIAITANGPVILETNIGWDTDSIQYFHDLPLGDTEFVRCAVARLNSLK